ncbi:bifunctional (p)ppGpp synthetase/guanosine-3',5'-bis(diphosphate) 3'-pyrophosphohydrolase (plasmid) [Acaryochloris sp. 'Moss Beach']|uniref:TGS domain-containing protein n=1 Tax=Acaryochloris sp. 'Moss Beach' TaxID=2740837 RepID=UPI001F24057E|nr:TGS domain-containing protein [Acaryochloris sp. 'Moss Beach']UJB73118.1 bifunctional (p)ppGpp synthetase/guanosine-3',5'-bis(diphosphate) 3'-pyrophosphohydrolase [Acaryochloris sp. 'Moss Beach']
MCRILVCANTLLDLALKPGWDSSDVNLENRIKNIEILQTLIDSGEVTLYLPQDLVQYVHLVITENLGSEKARQLLQKVVLLGNTEIATDWLTILEQANNLELYPDDTELYELTSLVYCNEINADSLIVQDASRYRYILEYNSIQLHDFNTHILTLNSFLALFSEHKLKAFSQPQTIFTFTKNNTVVKLPKGSTAIDFAYKIHTHLGDRCFKAIVNDVEYPLDKPLKYGDIVWIVKGTKPNPDPKWIDYVKTKTAKDAIQRRLKRISTEKGWNTIKNELGKNIRAYRKELDKVTQELGYQDLNALAMQLGNRNISIDYVISLIHEERGDINDQCLSTTISNSKKIKGFK